MVCIFSIENIPNSPADSDTVAMRTSVSHHGGRSGPRSVREVVGAISSSMLHGVTGWISLSTSVPPIIGTAVRSCWLTPHVSLCLHI